MNGMIDITRCPLTLILSKTQIILSNMKSYKNDEKACLYEVPKFKVRCISGNDGFSSLFQIDRVFNYMYITFFLGTSCATTSITEDDFLFCSQNGEDVITKSSVREIGKPLTRKGTIIDTIDCEQSFFFCNKD